MSKYAIVIEREPGNKTLGAYVPDLPGCVAFSKSETELLSLINEAIELHIESLREHGDPVPRPRTKVLYSISNEEPQTKASSGTYRRVQEKVSSTRKRNYAKDTTLTQGSHRRVVEKSSRNVATKAVGTTAKRVAKKR